MTQLIAHPFRLAGGAVATVDDQSDEGIAQEIALICTTRVGERPMAPGYGIPDPAFSRFDVNDIAAGMSLYGPDGVLIDDLVVELDTSGLVATATVTFSHLTD